MAAADVVVCGFGPTGAVAANLLGQRGIRTLVVDRASGIFPLPRAVHFDGETMRTFQALGLGPEVERVSAPAEALSFLGGGRRELYRVEREPSRTRHGWPSGSFFTQPALERALREGVARFPCVEQRLGVELVGLSQDGQGVRATLRGAGGEAEAVEAGFLLACDGAASSIRTEIGVELEDLGCDEPWLVCDTALAPGPELRNEVRQICDPRRPATLIPCPGGQVRWEFKVLPEDDPRELESAATVRRLAQPYLHLLHPALAAEDLRVVRSTVYTFHGLIARRFRVGRVFLLGDAAHQMPPFLGQGLCAGIRDAFNLCWKLAGVLQGRFRPDLLETYCSERRPHARRVAAHARRLGRLIQTRSRPLAGLRDGLFRLARKRPALLPLFAGEPGWPLGPGLFDRGASVSRASPIDQAWVRDCAGQRRRLDDLLGPEFAVIGFGCDPAGLAGPATASVWERLSTRFLQVAPREQREDGAARAAVVDADGALMAWRQRAGRARARLAVVRPDRQVFGLYAEADPPARALEGAAARLGALAIP
jgi:3-(3-hydroxy-phenyl)propionate hydroxylase